MIAPEVVSALLFRNETLDGIAAGSVTLAFRRWERGRVRVGSRLRTPAGVVEIDGVEVVEESARGPAGFPPVSRPPADPWRRKKACKHGGGTSGLGDVAPQIHPSSQAWYAAAWRLETPSFAIAEERARG